MKCLSCGYHDTKVIDSRLSGAGVAIRRRRQCLKCDFRFSTVEEVQILDLTVIKRDGSREPYGRPKLVAGLQKSFEKRPITREDFDRLVQIIERDIQAMRQPEISTSAIGELVMKRLKQVDEVAFIRFASVYQGFANAETFHEAIEQLFRQRAKRAKANAKKDSRRRSPSPSRKSAQKTARKKQ